MKKLIRIIVLLLLIFSFGKVGNTQMICGTDEDQNSDPLIQSCPELNLDVSTIFEIPVIVHVMYNEDFENVGYTEIVDMISIANSQIETESIYSNGIFNDVSIKLILVEGSGACLPGYDRVYIDNPNINANNYDEVVSEDVRIKNNNVLDVEKYLNVWIVESIKFPDGIVYGYSIDEGDGIDDRTEGIVLDYVHLDRLIHEFGHYLALEHPWQGKCFRHDWPKTCTYGDQIDDTEAVMDYLKENNDVYYIPEDMCDCWINGFVPDSPNSEPPCDVEPPVNPVACNSAYIYPAGNYMTYQINCWREFTNRQYIKMINFANLFKNELIINNTSVINDLSSNEDHNITQLLSALDYTTVDQLCENEELKILELGGNLIVDQTICLKNLKFDMQDNAKIIVINNSILNLDNTHLYNCDGFWDKIYVLPGSTLDVSNNCKIEKAKIGIEAEKGATININNSVFHNNVVGIRLTENGIGEHTLFSMSNSRISSDDTYSYLAFDIMWDRPFAGIIIDEQNYVNLSTRSGSENHFKRLSNGIVANNSRIKVEYGVFDDIYSGLGNTNYASLHSDDGYAIKISGGTYHSGITRNTITNAKYGIGVENTNVKINTNTIHQTVQGVLLSHVGKFDIVNNDIVAEERGIYIGFNHLYTYGDLAYFSNVSRNYVTITGDGDNAKAIEYEETVTFDSDNNWITINSNDAGFYITNASGCSLWDNTIDIFGNNSDVITDAIHIENSNRTWLYNNLLQDYTSSTDNNGVYAQTSQGYYHCNYTFNFDNGMRFIDNCDGSYLKSNNYNYNQRDLVVGLEDGTGIAAAESWIGPQGSIPNLEGNGNKWENADSRAQNSAPSYIVAMSQFFVNAPTNSIYEPEVITADGQWFNNRPDIENRDWCPDDDPGTNLPPKCLDLITKILTIDTMSRVDDCKKLMWQYQYYKKLLELKNRNLLSAECLLFLNSQNNNVLVQIANVGIAMDSLSVLQGGSGMFNELVNLTSILDSLYSIGNVNTSEWNQTMTTYSEIITEYQTVVDDEREGGRTRTDSVKNVITTITVTDSCLQVLLNVYTIRLNLIKSDTLTENELSYLQGIAESCPSDMGNGVFAARSMMSLYGNFRYPRIDECVSGDLIPRSTISSSDTKLKVYPNPATDEVNIIVKLSEYEKGIVELIDIQGNVLDEFIVEKNTNTIKLGTRDFIPGLYIVKYNSKSGDETIKKLMIVK